MAEPLTPAGVETLFRLMLRRPVWDDVYTKHLVETGTTFGDLIDRLRRSEEVAAQISAEARHTGIGVAGGVDGAAYVTPRNLASGPAKGGRCLLVGGCLLHAWPEILAVSHPEWTLQMVLFNNVSALPVRSAHEIAGHDFQILHPPLRFILPDTVYFELLSASREPQALLEGCLERLRFVFQSLTGYAKAFYLPAFVLSLPTPQRPTSGRFSEVHSLANPARFIDALNAELERLCRSCPAVFFYDFDQTIGLYGRKSIQDDAVFTSNHGGNLGVIETPLDAGRLEAVGDPTDLYRPRHGPIFAAVFADLVGAYRSLQQADALKLVVFDLDDTLWRGVAAERDSLDGDMVEGWPLGILEAIVTLHARGVLVALASKNDSSSAEKTWRALYQKHFPWEAFFAREISWGDKAESVARIVQHANVLPSAVLFVDDNPAERARVSGALPGLRVLDAPVAEWKRILLWSPELQSAFFTTEATGRSQSLQKRPQAEQAAESREAFLARLDVRVEIDQADSMVAGALGRLFELLNKTNQFNTTGQRWTLPEIASLFDSGGRMVFARVRDAFTDYGLTALAIVKGDRIVQVVMSCRVFGLEVETILLQAAIKDLRAQGVEDVFAHARETSHNGPCRGLFEAAGFVSEGGEPDRLWRLSARA